ncbi:methyltransferase family protein [Planctomyces sp. SH-PL62]|uniref:methyltransferase family protein n=1 Tax=Planctomyces sp. SH-PL62 TaxID=1636152 RepID=UPI00078E8AEC|nr:isoprenylcysteine carboxylmethyltransferase family protein [Planctomyces sp. SH-PL62]AMV40511.1 Isoprenylcysteine carboxyl methyltransferase (ICMT) family protein [Planctomyces sp. SH-PL62]
MTTDGVSSPRPEHVDRRRLVVSTACSVLVLALCLFLPAGTWAWPNGWLFFAVTVAAGSVISVYLQRVNPEVIAARVNHHEGTKPWNRRLVSLLFPTLISIIPIAALDGGRYHWSHVPWWGCATGYALFLAGIAGLTWAESVNKFFEPTVRIQADRGHRVVDAGPYALVRHPGYVAVGALVPGMALSLGSYWALVPAAASYLLLIVRTAREDRTLQEELPGYREYARRVRYRLVPGVW